MKKTILYLAILLVILQTIPYGRDHDNPEVLAEPEWDSNKTRDLFMKTCGDCHSYETVWPWYSNIAPASWLVAYDVEEGRKHLNVSAWGYAKNGDADEAAEELEEGKMPPPQYLWVHRDKMLSTAESKSLVEGLKLTFGDKRDED